MKIPARIWPCLLAAAFFASAAQAAPLVHCKAPALIRFTGEGTPVPNAGWFWFSGPRLMVEEDNPDGPQLVMGAVSSGEQGMPHSGNIWALTYNLATHKKTSFALYNRLASDDHAVPVFAGLPDGRILAAYSRHSADPHIFWQLSRVRYDAAQFVPASFYTTPGNATYTSLLYLSRPDMVFAFYRSSGKSRFPYFAQLSMSGLDLEWGDSRRLLTTGAQDPVQPYLLYASNGKNRIHFIATESSPSNNDNNLLHGFMEVDPLGNVSFNTSSGVALRYRGEAPDISQLTPAFLTGSVLQSKRLTHAFPVDLKLDAAGTPFALITVREDGDSQRHHFVLARYDVVSRQWRNYYVASAGTHLQAGETDYTGLGTIDPVDTRVVYISTPIDPVSGEALAHYELFRGSLTSAGTWLWQWVTRDSPSDNLRPAAVASDGHTVLVWMRGNYSGIHKWDTQLVGAMLDKEGCGL